MTTRLHERTIPSAFVRLDATMSDADAYYNVRDAQIARQNHNALIARVVRQPCFSLLFRRDNGSASYLGVTYKSLGTVPLSGGLPMPEMFLQLPIWIPPWCQALELAGLFSFVATTGPDVPIYAKIDAEGDTTNWPSAPTFTINVDEAGSPTGTRFAGEVVVPQNAAMQGYCTLSVAMDGQVYGAGAGKPSGVAIRDAGIDNGRPFIDADFAATSTGDAIGITNKATLGLRLCVEDFNIGTDALNGTANTWRLYLDRAFNQAPEIGSDTAFSADVQSINAYTLSGWPKRVTEFEAGVELP